MKQIVFAPLVLVCILGLGCGEKDSTSNQATPLHLVKTALPTLKLTMQAPEGAKVTGTSVVSVRKDSVFSIQVQKDIFGASGDTLIIPFEKRLLKKKLVDEPNLQIWTKKMGGDTVVLFAMTVKVGPAKYYVQSGPMGTFTRAQVDAMVKAAQTLAAQ